ncbi:DNA cytosine methyltransferase [Streptomonospora salina]
MLVDDDPHACATLRANRPNWDVRQMDVADLVGAEHPQILDVDLLAGGLPSVPYSQAGRGKGAGDSRDLLRQSIWLAGEVQPRALMLQNVPRLLTESTFEDARKFVREELEHLGYAYDWRILDAREFGVHQRRPYSVLVAMRPDDMSRFRWPEPAPGARTVGEVLWSSMASRGWPYAAEWRRIADGIAPTIVGGSRDRGGADLGPSRSKAAWARLGVNGDSIADDVPGPDFELRAGEGTKDRAGLPKLTADQAAVLQGIPDDWTITGRKTARYRQIGHAFPPPLATIMGESIARALER